MTHSSTWKQAERRIASLFGCKRRPLSGSNSGGGSDDVMHDVLYIENKLAARHTVWTLWKDTWKKAKKEGKIPVISLQQKNHKGILLVIHSNDLPAVLAEYRKARKAWEEL